MWSHASLNHIYRTVWNEALGAMVAVAEVATTARRRKAASGSTPDRALVPLFLACRLASLALAIACGWGLQTTEVFANPSGAVAVVGQASVVNQGNKLTVTTQNGTGTNYSAINWQSFSIPAGSTTFFQQPSATSTSINRVVSNTPSVLFGTLGSNGNLVLVNQSGIAVGAGAVVDTGGFTASSLRMSDADALAGRLLFGDALATGAGLSVQGRILARSGDVVLLGSTVDAGKDALIQAPNGSTILAAGRQIELTGRGLEGISLQVQAPSDQAVNLGTLQGNAVGIFAGTLKHSGLIQATSATLEGGKVVLKASGDAYVEGTGTINATGTKGGSVDVLGNRVALTDQASIDASGEQGGGTVRIGGDYQGKNPDVQNAQYSYFGPQASIRADATDMGDGGKVIVWADDTTRAFGSISARGGEQGGQGGFVETSGHGHLDLSGLRVDTRSGDGQAGTWLLDPGQVDIVAGSISTNISAGPDFAPVAGVSTLSDMQLNSALATSNVSVTTSGGSGGTGNITLTDGAAIGYFGGVTRSLTLTAENDILLQGSIQNSSTGPGVLTLSLNAGNSIQTPAGKAFTATGLFTAPVAIEVGGGKTWNNYGTVSLQGNAIIDLDPLGTGTSVATFHNQASGTLTVNSTHGWAFQSSSAAQNGTISNDGVVNVTASTAFEAAYGQGASGTLNVKDASLNLQNAKTILGTVDLLPTGAANGASLSVNEFHGSGASFANTLFNGGSLTVAGTVGGTPTASFTGVSAPTTQLNVGSGSTVPGNVSILGNSTFSGLNLVSGTLAINNAALGIAGGDFTVPAGVSYTGKVGYYATGSVSLPATADIVTSGGDVTLLGAWNGDISAPAVGANGAGGVTVTGSRITTDGSIILKAGSTGITTSGVGTGSGSEFLQATRIALDSSGPITVGMLSGEVVARTTGSAAPISIRSSGDLVIGSTALSSVPAGVSTNGSSVELLSDGLGKLTVNGAVTGTTVSLDGGSGGISGDATVTGSTLRLQFGGGMGAIGTAAKPLQSSSIGGSGSADISTGNSDGNGSSSIFMHHIGDATLLKIGANFQNPDRQVDISATGGLKAASISTGTADLALSAGGRLEVPALTSLAGANVTLVGDQIDITADGNPASINAGTGLAWFKPASAGRATDLGAKAGLSNTLELSTAELNVVTAGTLRLGSLAAGDLHISAAIAPAPALVGALSLASGAGITQAPGATISADSLAIRAKGDVLLTADNAVTNVAASLSGSASPGFSLKSSGALNVAGTIDGVSSVSTPGMVALTSAGALTQSAGALLSATSVYAEGSSVILEEANPPGVIAGKATGSALGDIFSYRSINGIFVTTVNGFSGIQTSTPLNGISVVLRSGSAAIGQDAPIDAGTASKGLKLVTTGPVDLTNSANQVGALTAVGVGGLKFSNSSALSVGGAGVSSSANQPIEIKASGLLNINQPVISGAGTAGAVSLMGAGVTVSSTVTGPGGVTIDAGGGDLNNSSGTINTTGSTSGGVKLFADTMTLAGGSISAGSDGVGLAASTAGRPVLIGGSGTGVLSLLASDLQSVTTSGGLRVGDLTSGGSVTVVGAITNTNLAGVSQYFGLGSSNGQIAINSALTSPVQVILKTGGAILQNEVLGGSIVAPSLSTESGTGTTLNGANSVSGFSATNSVSGPLSFKDIAADLNLSGGSLTGAGAITISNTGNIAVSGPLGSDGNMSLSSSTGNVLFTTAGTGTNATIGTLTSSGSTARVTVQAGGSIKSDHTGSASIMASEVVLKAVTGIQGSCGTSCTNTAGFPVQATFIDVSNADTSGTFPQKLATIGATGSVTVKDLDADGKSISVGTTGDVMVSAGGNLAVQDGVVAATGYFTAGTANVSVSSPLALSGAAHFWGDTLNIKETISAATLEFASNNPVTVDAGKTVTATDTSGTGGIRFKAIGAADTTLGTGTGFVVDPATLGATGKTFNAPQFSFGSSANAGAVTVNGVVNLPASDVVLTGASIAINASLSTGGKLDISSAGTVTASAAVNAGTLALQSGTWSQIALTLPSFTASDFQLAGGSTFIRALGGDGSTGLPYQLADIYGVQGAGSSGMLGKSYVLANNMDATGTANWNSGSGFAGVGSMGGFSGSFDGLNHTISNLSSRVGLFELAGAGALISNVGLLNTIVNASGSSAGLVIGGLVASNNGGAISNSYVTGSVSGDANGTGGGVTGGGLVGINQGGGTISNSRASSNVTVTGPSSWVGGLVGVNVNGVISGSFATGTVSGTATTSGSVVGGLIGQHNGGTVSQSYATGSVSGNGAASTVGGLMGVAQGTVSNSYATGSVSGSGTGSYIGGLAGVVVGSIDTSYATGSVTWSGTGSYIGGLAGLNSGGTVSNTVWDVQTSGQTTGIGGGSSTTGATGLTTAQMKQTASFANWNAGGVNGIANTGNSGAVWRIYEGHTTPLLTTFLTIYVLAGVPDVVKTYNGSAQSGGNISSAINGVLGVAATGTNAGFYNGYYSSQQGYDLVGGNLTINGAALSAVSMSGTRVYDGTADVAASIFKLSGLMPGETLTLSGTGTVADKNVGVDKPVTLGTLTLGNGTGLASNYTFTGGTQVATITAATISGVSGITAANKVYDGKTSATLNTSSAILAGAISGDALTVTGGVGAFADKNAGLGKVVNITGLALGGTDAINYTLSSSTASTTADISKLALSGVSGITAASKVYDGNTGVSINSSNATLVGEVSGDVLIVTGGVGAFADKNAGSGKVVNITGLGLGGTDAVNYTLSSSASSTLADISKLTLSGVSGITAANKVYDGNTSATINTSHATVVGVIGSDAVTVTGGVAAFADKNAGSGKLVNITGLGLGGTDAINYALGNTTASTPADISKLTLSGVSGITVASKVYDGNTSATINTSNAKLAGAVSGDVLTVTGGTGLFADKNAGVGKDVSITGLGLGGTDAINYALASSTASGTADISKATITAVGGISISDKVYDGKLTATAVTSGATLVGLISGDKVSVDSAVAAFTDRNVGVDKPVNITSVTLGGVDAVNYTLTSSSGSAKGNITIRPLANWTAVAGGSWSTAGNWDALPDGSNVLAVSIPANVVVTYDAGAGNTSLQAFSGGAGFAMSGGSLTLASGLSTPQYNQSGGSLILGGSLNVNGSFSQSAGSSISATGPVAISQGNGNLAVGAITAPAISLSAPGGSISQSGALVTSGLLTTQSLTSTSLNDTGNRIRSFKASSAGVGDISLTNVGVLDIEGINTAAGNITVFNTGGVVTQQAVVANGGKVSITANSPLTIGSEGITATGDIDLVATNLTSAGNLTLDGDLVSSNGAIALSAASDFVQNGSVSAALGLSMNAGGNVTLGPNATSFGNPVHYASHGAELAAPPGSQKSGGTPVDFVATFLTRFQESITSPALVSVDSPDSSTSKEKKTLAVEGEICSR